MYGSIKEKRNCRGHYTLGENNYFAFESLSQNV